MILPIGLFALFLFRVVQTVISIRWQQRTVERRYRRIHTLGTRTYLFREFLSLSVSTVLLIASLRYLYFSYFWAGFAAVSGLVTFVLLLAVLYETLATKYAPRYNDFKQYEHEQNPDEWRQHELKKFRRKTPLQLFLVVFRALSWTKGLPQNVSCGVVIDLSINGIKGVRVCWASMCCGTYS